MPLPMVQAQSCTKLLLSLPLKHTTVTLGYCPDGVPNPSPRLPTVDVGSCYFCRRASAVIIRHGRQRKGHKRKFIFSSLKLMASSLFMLLIYSIPCIASASRRALYRKTRHRRMNRAHMGSECPALERRGQFKLGRG